MIWVTVFCLFFLFFFFVFIFLVAVVVVVFNQENGSKAQHELGLGEERQK